MTTALNLAFKLDPKHMDLVLKFIADVKNKKLEGSDKIALATLTLLEQVILEAKNATAIELKSLIRAVSSEIRRALPQLLVAANIARRLLRAVTDEYRQSLNQSVEGAGESLQRLVLGAGLRRGTLGGALHVSGALREHVQELRIEIECSVSSICGMAVEYVHGDELILTYGSCLLVERFLKAALARRYRLIVVEGGGSVQQCHAMASRLSQAGVPVTLISNTAVCAVMSRVNKVIMSVESVLAGGGAVAAVGGKLLTTAAHYYRVPVICLTPLYKLSPLHACGEHRLDSVLTTPADTMEYQSLDSGSVGVYAPLYDTIPPDHITLFITSLGGSSPSYIYRLLSELYDPNDS